MTLDLIIRNARLPGGRGRPLMDIGIRDGTIVALESHLDADGPEHDACGKLVTPGLIESHFHLDKALHGRSRAVSAQPHGARPHAAHGLGQTHVHVDDIYERAPRTIEQCLLHGVTHMRTQVEVDPNVGLLGFEAIEQLRKDYAWAIDIQPCVFLQEGWTGVPGADENLVTCLERGAPVVGGGIRYDKDGPGQIRRVFELAQQYDIDVDFHLDGGYDVNDLDYPQVCEITDQHRLAGPRRLWARLQIFLHAGQRAGSHRQAARTVWRVARGPAGDRPLQCGTAHGAQRDARRDRRQHADRKRRELHA